MIGDYNELEMDVDQNGAPSPTGEIRHGVRHLTRDILTLAELQASLFQVEARNWLQKVAIPALVLGVCAAVIALASLPILLLSLAYWLVDVTELSLPAALLASGGGGLLVALICAAIAAQRVKRGRGAFKRFQFELSRNVRWLKQILGRPTEAAASFAPDAAPLRPR